MRPHLRAEGLEDLGLRVALGFYCVGPECGCKGASGHLLSRVLVVGLVVQALVSFCKYSAHYPTRVQQSHLIRESSLLQRISFCKHDTPSPYPSPSPFSLTLNLPLILPLILPLPLPLPLSHTLTLTLTLALALALALTLTFPFLRRNRARRRLKRRWRALAAR